MAKLLNSMESVQDHLNRLRDERTAREKARIEKLRELNLKKYNKNQTQTNNSVKHNGKSNSCVNRPASAPIVKDTVVNIKKTIAKTNTKPTNTNGDVKLVKDIKKSNESRPCNIQKFNNCANNLHTKPIKTNENLNVSKNNLKINALVAKPNNLKKLESVNEVNALKGQNNRKSMAPESNTLKAQNNRKAMAPEPNTLKGQNNRKSMAPEPNTLKGHNNRKSMAPESNTLKGHNSRKSIAVLSKPNKVADTINSIQPKSQNETKSRESVFDRLYKPKVVPKINIETNEMKLKKDPNYLRQVIRASNLIINKRHTVFETKEKTPLLVRRSISAVHFKRISKSELSNCIQKWTSIGENINKVHLNDINEDEYVQEEKIISSVKSERKRVKFQTPISSNFNTPKPAELQERLQTWLQKRGKSIDAYHHLQCFGLHHLPRDFRTISKQINLQEDDENKENIALEHDSDNESYTENTNDKKEELNMEAKNIDLDKWRRASYVSDSVGFNESCDTIMSTEGLPQVYELLLGALNDLTELLHEGFDWEQCARWLRAIRERFPEAPEGAAYWECRAALEERRGDLPASVQCWERAIANGTEQSVVEANLDHLLDKFMQLKISPSSGRQRAADPKLLDVKNVFKSTIIRFAVQQAKLRQSNGTPKYTVTPVRRSSRLSCIPRATPLKTWTTPSATPKTKDTPRSHARATPLSLCKSFHQAAELFPVEFKPNKALIQTP